MLAKRAARSAGSEVKLELTNMLTTKMKSIREEVNKGPAGTFR